MSEVRCRECGGVSGSTEFTICRCSVNMLNQAIPREDRAKIDCPCQRWASDDLSYLQSNGTRHHPSCDGKGGHKVDEAVCGACGHAGRLHNPKAFKGTCKGSTGCPCTSPRESFECLEPQAAVRLVNPAYDYISRDKPTLQEQANDLFGKPDTSLQLLLIDLGDSVCVKVESGRLPTNLVNTSQSALTESGPYLFFGTFAAVRDAIDSQDKPLPRLERQDRGIYRLIADSDIDFDVPIGQAHYDALSALADKPLPIYEPTEGKWERLAASENDGGWTGLPVGVWRYRR